MSGCMMNVEVRREVEGVGGRGLTSPSINYLPLHRKEERGPGEEVDTTKGIVLYPSRRIVIPELQVDAVTCDIGARVLAS